MCREQRIVYFDQRGPANTAKVLEISSQAWKDYCPARVVVASTNGDTAVRALDLFPPQDIVVVGHHVGFREPGVSEFGADALRTLQEKGANVIFASHVLSGIGRSITKKFGGATPVEIMAHTLRILGEGFKVCCEMAIMGADAGVIPVDRESLFIAGSGRGADTAVIMKPTHANSWFDMGVPKILCMPSSRKR